MFSWTIHVDKQQGRTRSALVDFLNVNLSLHFSTAHITMHRRIIFASEWRNQKWKLSFLFSNGLKINFSYL